MPCAPEMPDPLLDWPHLWRAPAEGPVGVPPLLLLLHGHGRFQVHLHEPMAAAADAGFEIVALQAPYRIGPGAYRWFDYTRHPDGRIEIDRGEQAQSQARLMALISALSGRRAGHLFVVGHSQGGMMALCALYARPDLIRAVAVLNGRLLTEATPRRAPSRLSEVPVFVGHGTEDDTIPVARARELKAHLSVSGTPLTYREYAAGHDPAPEMYADVTRWLSDTLDRTAAARAVPTVAQ